MRNIKVYKEVFRNCDKKNKRFEKENSKQLTEKEAAMQFVDNRINEENKIKEIENTKNELSNDSEIKDFLDEFDGEIEIVTKIKS